VQAFDGSAGGCEVHFSTTEPVVNLSSNGTLVITGGGMQGGGRRLLRRDASCRRARRRLARLGS